MPDAEPARREPPKRHLAEVTPIERDGVRIVTVAGELDISNVATLAEATLDLTNEQLGIVVDLSAATYLDSAALGLLFKLRRSLQQRGQELRVVCAPASLTRRVLDLGGFDPQITDGDRDTAIAAIRAAVPLRSSAQRHGTPPAPLDGRAA
jgi:stage II sporulation protein AA (anti-sigma F factor antagonist)